MTYDPTEPFPRPGRDRIEVTDIAPCLLDHFGLDVPSYMKRSGALTF